MRFRDGTVADVPVRMCRISFTGELSYELHVSPWQSQHVWESVMAAGEPFGITPYGTEAMHVLRAEKGYVIVGQETDGTQTPEDLGMGWIVNPGKRIHLQALAGAKRHRARGPQAPCRPPHRGSRVRAGGGHAGYRRSRDTGTAGAHAGLGHVVLRERGRGTSIALALVERGRERRGDTVHAVLGDRTMACTVRTRSSTTSRGRGAMAEPRSALGSRGTGPRRTAGRRGAVPDADRRSMRARACRPAGVPVVGEHGCGRPDARCAVAGPRRVARGWPAGYREGDGGRARAGARRRASRGRRRQREPRGARASRCDRNELLASGRSLDLDPRGGWVPGACAQTMFARAQVILQELEGATRVFVRPSFAHYVVDRLLASRST